MTTISQSGSTARRDTLVIDSIPKALGASTSLMTPVLGAAAGATVARRVGIKTPIGIGIGLLAGSAASLAGYSLINDGLDKRGVRPALDAIGGAVAAVAATAVASRFAPARLHALPPLAGIAAFFGGIAVTDWLTKPLRD